MTLLAFDGFDLGDVAIRPTYTANTYNTSTTTRFTSGRSLAPNSNTAVKCAVTASATMVVGAALYTSGGLIGYQFYGDSAATLHLTVILSNTAITVYRGDWGGTVLATYSTGITSATWYYVETKVTISDTTGTVEVRLNGSTTPIINLTGVDTKNGGTATNVDAIGFRGVSGAYGLIDDWYVCNTSGTANNDFLGDVRVYTLSPSAAGNYTQFTPSTGSNYTCVDEQPYNTTDYVSDGTTGQSDSYAMADLPGTVTGVFGTQEVAIADKSDAGAVTLKQLMRISATDYTTTAITPGTSYASVLNLRETNPNTGAAWTAAGVNGAEVGVQVG